MDFLVYLDYVDLDLQPKLIDKDDKNRYARASFLSIDKVFKVKKSLYLFEINEKIVIIDTASMKAHCSCMDFASRRHSKNRYCKHIYRAVRWLVESKDKSIKITSNQFVIERFSNLKFLR